MMPAIAVILIVALLLIAGCSKKVPAAAPTTPTVPAVQTTPAATTPQVQQALPEGPTTPPELTQVDQSVKDIGTSDLDSVNNDIDKMAVP